MEYRLAKGWKYGKTKDIAKREHPDLVPFAELPAVEQRKDIMDLHARKVALNLWNATKGD